MVRKYIKLNKQTYEPIWAGWFLPLALPMIDGIVTIDTSIWLGILEICLGIAGGSSLLIHELRGSDLGLKQNH